MKKVLPFALVLVLLFFMCIFVFASEAPAGEDTVYYGKSEISELNQIPCATAENPDKNIAMEEDEDTVYYGINELNPEDFIYIAPATVQRARASYMRFEFPGAVYNSVYSDFIENVITAGASAILNVNTCVWAPESNNLEIGIYNWTTAENWYVVKSGGQAMNDFIIFTNLTAGSYSVYIRNRGTSSLTTGYLLYHLR